MTASPTILDADPASLAAHLPFSLDPGTSLDRFPGLEGLVLNGRRTAGSEHLVLFATDRADGGGRTIRLKKPEASPVRARRRARRSRLAVDLVTGPSVMPVERDVVLDIPSSGGGHACHVPVVVSRYETGSTFREFAGQASVFTINLLIAAAAYAAHRIHHGVENGRRAILLDIAPDNLIFRRRFDPETDLPDVAFIDVDGLLPVSSTTRAFTRRVSKNQKAHLVAVAPEVLQRNVTPPGPQADVLALARCWAWLLHGETPRSGMWEADHFGGDALLDELHDGQGIDPEHAAELDAIIAAANAGPLARRPASGAEFAMQLITWNENVAEDVANA